MSLAQMLSTVCACALLAGVCGAAPAVSAVAASPAVLPRPGAKDADKARAADQATGIRRGSSRGGAAPAAQPPAAVTQHGHAPTPARAASTVSSANAVRLKSLLAAKASPHAASHAAISRGLAKNVGAIAAKPGATQSAAARRIAAAPKAIGTSSVGGPRRVGGAGLGGAASVARMTHIAVLDGSQIHRKHN